jgi:hypothetical protein
MKKFTKLIFLGILFLGLNGCVKQPNSLNIPNVINPNTKEIKNVSSEIPLPYVKESKYIKILVLPFENAENDIDYGGYIETKLESSKFIFGDNIKNKILKDDTIGGI